ncbi:unnamed protein product, partial [marine sediment metagenome]
KQWKKEIERCHPIISYFPPEQWPEVAKFN